MIKVLVVDDSAFMRKAISTLLEKDQNIKVVGTATNGMEALELIPKLNPDVVTLDIEMPRMDGITALQHIMKDMPRPVLMVSSLTTEGAEVTLKAMDYGAVDFIPKPRSNVSLDIIHLEVELQEKVKAVASRRLVPRALFSRTPATPDKAPATSAVRPPARSGISATTPSSGFVTKPTGKRLLRDVVAIGVSTGGPPAVQKVLSSLPEDFPAAILIAQHMPAAFTGPFSKRLDSLCKVRVKEAEHGERVLDGHVYVAPGGLHMRLEVRGGTRSIVISEEPKSALYKPSANELIGSVGECLGSRGLGVVLTGMGSDGLEGAKILKARGGKALAQDDASCVVYGMPKAIVDAGLADEILSIDNMAAAIMDNLYK